MATNTNHPGNTFLFAVNDDIIQSSTRGIQTKNKSVKHVTFAEALENVQYFYSYEQDQNNPQEQDDILGTTMESSQSRATSQLTVLSTAHGKARRELRSITKFDLQSAVKYGVKTRGRNNPKTGATRWKYVYANVVYITDYTSTIEVTSYKEPIDIQPATITPEMQLQHDQDVEALKNDPQLCASHSIIIIDQSGSMKTSDVPGFRTRSQAAYGVLALEYIADQLHQRGSHDGILDAVSIIEMNDVGTLVYYKEPLDWILFNKLVVRQQMARPRSHGNYNPSLELAMQLMDKELMHTTAEELEDFPSYVIVFLSDGKPSDKDLVEEAHRRSTMTSLCQTYKSNISLFYAIGLGSDASDFFALKKMVCWAQLAGVEAQFSFSQLSCSELSSAFSTVSSKVTTTRTDALVDKTNGKREKKVFKLRDKSTASKDRKVRKFHRNVSRWRYDHKKHEEQDSFPWTKINFKNKNACAFEMEVDPFGKGAERLAYIFYEINKNSKRLGKEMVAKESVNINDEERKVKFHEDFCRATRKANEMAELFNKAVKKSPQLWPTDKSMKTPDIMFLKCFVYVYEASDGEDCGLLVEKYLKGKFTKYNSNNGMVYKAKNGKTIDLKIGEVLLTDFLQAFSHWVYVSTDHQMLVCDLQGVLNEEGRHPKFELTDPCICTKKRHGRYGNTNIGMKGFRAFRKSHICGKVCKGLGLPPFGMKSGAKDF